MRHIATILIAGVVALGGAAFAQDNPDDPVRKVRERLGTMRITLDFNNAKLDEVIAYFQEFSGLNFHLDADARAKEAEDGAKVTIKLKDVTLRTALKLILNPRDFGCVYRDGVILIATKARLGAQTVTRVYDVRDLIFRIQDFPGPILELKPHESGMIFNPPEEPKTIFDEENLPVLIKANTGDRSWDDSSAASISQINGLLVISQTKQVHEEVLRLLDLLRQYK